MPSPSPYFSVIFVFDPDVNQYITPFDKLRVKFPCKFRPDWSATISLELLDNLKVLIFEAFSLHPVTTFLSSFVFSPPCKVSSSFLKTEMINSNISSLQNIEHCRKVKG